ncbi:TonB-dependent receptor [Pseudoalteromonas tunicata]|jgi:iron complex outermembrane receptor protein|uniref:Putative TonB-dependent receptor protein n=1 Tax=Pseudoalteromonas tunicata D2 TaxID=87626 RepID=A4CBY9_9GAMM|nr:TonB-dependent receptor [Pseudoalteromonas tunicata]ATC94426.1 iron complex outermembrane recepter protein [Pseudoalteromonas tunicata]AXT30158.1 TonB-dependent receptor [Pseudoalteromonas tunicata]EAR27876.1 putative TonB-dependent receptor protein [Pseudoalteromonas tunicata D2]
MSKFKPSMLTLALVSAGFSSLSAFAADEVKKDEALNQENVEVIEVRGMRRSIVESINVKRFATNVVESISAEDIGKLPDSSIAESIARLPGLAAQRLDGRASRVSIRGFGENESGTTFNGREQVSISDNRGVEFDLYPSEIMSGVTVYKTPNATLEGEGIAGVIDMQTIKPLSKDGQTVQINTQFEQTSFDKLNPDGEDSGFRGTFSYVDQFADNTLGVAFAYSSMSSPNQEKRWNSWGYPEFTHNGKPLSILGGAKPFVRSSELERDSVMLVVEAAPTDKLKLTFDALYVDFLDTKTLRGIEIPFAWGQGSIKEENATVDPATGFVTSALTEGERVVVRNDHEERDATLKSFGLNTEYQVNDTWSLDLDVSYSKVERKIWSMESYSGTGRGSAVGIADNIGYQFNSGNTGAMFTHQLDYSDYNLIQLGGPLSWGGSSALNESLGIKDTPLKDTGQDGFINTPNIDDELKAIKFAATQVIESDFISALTYGVSRREREKQKVSEGYFMTLKSFPDTIVVPEEYRLGSVSLDFIGMGDMIAYDSKGLIDDGYYTLLAESLTDTKHATKSWTVKEKITSAFVQADINTEVAGLALTGGAGLRYVHTEQSSQGSAFTTNSAGLVLASPTDMEHSYSHLLPSLNLVLKLDDEQSLRFGVAKTISRARMDDMNASIDADYKTKPDDNGNYWIVSGGNTLLEPKEATGIDLSYENYFSDEGYFSAAFFHKDLNQWIFDGAYEVDMTGVAVPATGEIPPHSTGTGSGKVNGGGGTLWGYELAVTFPFKLIDESLEGFGIMASHTGINSDMEDQKGNEFELPGLSDQIQSFTLYYENYGIQSRVSMRKRSDFKGDVYGLGFDSQQVDILGETIWDAQIGYSFEESQVQALQGLTVSFQVQNITEEPFTSLSGDNKLQVRDYQDYGRTYLLGVSYKF